MRVVRRALLWIRVREMAGWNPLYSPSRALRLHGERAAEVLWDAARGSS